VEELLRPLFCTVDINLQSAIEVNFDNLGGLFIDSQFGAQNGPTLRKSDYDALVGEFKQRIVDGNGRPLRDKDRQPIVDTFFKLTFPARGELDFRHQFELMNREPKIVDFDFISDVRHVDFTRPIFSPARCGLLKHAPKLTGRDINVEEIRKGFVTNLKKDSSPAAQQLLASFTSKQHQDAHQADVDRFVAACKRRPPKELLADIMRFASHQRRAMRANVAKGLESGILEFSETMVVDDIPDSNRALDPVDCTLK
jgi:hypothetical protein